MCCADPGLKLLSEIKLCLQVEWDDDYEQDLRDHLADQNPEKPAPVEDLVLECSDEEDMQV